MTLGSDNEFPKILLVEGAAPAAPAAGRVKLYAKSDGLLYWKDDAGTEYAVGTLVASDLTAHTGDTSDAHDASAISIADAGAYFTGTDVEAALQELGAGGGGGSVATDTIWDAAGDLAVGSGANTAARLAAGSEGDVLTIDSGVPAWVAPTGGGGTPNGARNPVQEKDFGHGNSGTPGVTLDATPTVGNVLFALFALEGAVNVSSISQTNVTWTKLAESTASTAPHVELWKGVVGSSPGTVVTATLSAGSWCGMLVCEFAGLAGTLDQSASVSNVASRKMPAITPTDPEALVIAVACTTANSASFANGHPGLAHLVAFETNYSKGYAYGFPGENGVHGTWMHVAGGTFSALTASVI